ncbi:MAG: cation diffusion facilitator family transporter [Candidatus Omnitrophota bacterium]|nr:cation diffusion facilitator family transporter [Candidatus Omnitrophota bacterium]
MNSRTFKANRVTWIGLFSNVFLTCLKLLAGIYGKSAAMIADAFHSLSDLGTDIVVLLGFRIIDKPADKSHDYGHGKVETLVLVVIGVVLLAAGLKICWSGSYRVFKFYQGRSIPEPGLIAFYVAVISIISKEWLYRYTLKTGKGINSRAVIANAWHHRSDAFSSIATMIGIGGAIMLGERWHILDPIAAIVVSFFIIKTAIVISADGINELIDASLDDRTENRIMDVVRSVPGANMPHNLKTRKIGNHIAVELHIKVNKDLNIEKGHDISTMVEKKIKEVFGEDVFISVHIEPS